MLPCKNLLLSFATLATALLFVAPVGIVAQNSDATCMSAYGWMNNTKGQSPCLVAAYLMSVCDDAPFVIQRLPPGYQYSGPYAIGQSSCGCSSVTYSAFSACAICQNATQANWSLWHSNCSDVSVGFYPPGVPSGTAVPHWMFQNVTANSDMFNLSLARSEVGEFPESTANQAQSTAVTRVSLTVAPIRTQASTSTQSGGGSNSNSKTGVIVGGVVGGVVGLLAIVGLAAFFLVKNKKHSQVPMVEHIPSAIYTDGTSSGLQDVVRP